MAYLLYHEILDPNSKLCGLHCLNALVQGPFFTEADLADVASYIDRPEVKVRIDRVDDGYGDDLVIQDVPYVAADQYCSIQVIENMLGLWRLQVIPIDSPAAEQARLEPGLETAFICHQINHWFCVRRVNRDWYAFNSLYAVPIPLSSKFYLAAYLDILKSSCGTIFVVRGNFQKECPARFNSYGQWYEPDAAKEISDSIPDSEAPPRPLKGQASLNHNYSGLSIPKIEEAFEDLDMKVAEAESLKDFDLSFSAFKAGSSGTESEGTTTSQDLNLEIVASLMNLLSFSFHTTDTKDAEAAADLMSLSTSDTDTSDFDTSVVLAAANLKNLSPSSSDTDTNDADNNGNNAASGSGSISVKNPYKESTVGASLEEAKTSDADADNAAAESDSISLKNADEGAPVVVVVDINVSVSDART